MSNHIDDLLSAYIDDELSEKERQQVEEHLNSCPECSLTLSDLLDIKHQVFTTFHSIQAPKTLEDTVFHTLSSSAPSNISQQRYWILLPLLSPLFLIAIAFALMGSFVFKIISIGLKVIINLVYAIGSILGSDPLIIGGLVIFSILLIIASSISLKIVLKTKAI